MLELAFILQNIHFAINLLAGLVFFSIAWLYFDAWTERKNPKEIHKFIGFLLLSISFAIHAALVEQSVQSTLFLRSDTIHILTIIMRLLGYILVLWGLILDPIQKKPQESGTPTPQLHAINISFVASLTNLFYLIFPFLSFAIAGLYLRRASTGLERHLKPVGFGFVILSLSEVFNLTILLRSSSNFVISDLSKPFGTLWMVEHLLLVLSIAILGDWVFRYLLKRIQTQLFIIFTSLFLVIFTIVTLIFSGMLFSNLKNEAIKNLKISANVLNFAIESKKAEALSDAQLVSQNPQVIAATIAKKGPQLESLTNEIISSKNQSYLIVISNTGEVLARPDNADTVGESLSDDKLFQQAKLGKEVAAVTIEQGVISPQVGIRAASPIKIGAETIGVIITGTIIDNAFVDGVKETTGLDSSVYAGVKMAATTLIAPDGKTRHIGINLRDKKFINLVLGKGQPYLGELDILSTPYVVAISPLKGIDGNTIGMLLIGKEKSAILQTISQSVELTFLASIVILLFAIIPIYFISKFITNQFTQ